MRLSVQLYTVRDSLAQDVPGTLKKLKGLGLDYVEMAGLHGRTADEWKAMLGDLGLSVSSSHASLDGLTNNIGAIADEAHTLGYTDVYCGYLTAQDYADGWKAVAKRFNGFGEQLHAKGVKFGYHNHDFEFALEDGVPGLDVLFANTNEAYVKSQLDLGWIWHGDANPVSYIEKYASRITSVHLKDAIRGHDVMDVMPGKGGIDWPTAIAACLKANVPFGSIELDNPPGDPVEIVAQCVEFFHGHGLR